jgi:hypothetical protein
MKLMKMTRAVSGESLEAPSVEHPALMVLVLLIQKLKKDDQKQRIGLLMVDYHQ